MGRVTSIFLLIISIVSTACSNSGNPQISTKDSSSTNQYSVLTKDSIKNTIDTQDTEEYKRRLHDIVERMNKNIGRISLTGNAENDFSRLMITNLFAGIEICQLHIKSGTDSALKQKAQDKLRFLQKQEDYFDSYQFNSNNSYTLSPTKKAPPLKHRNIHDGATKDMVFGNIILEYNQNTIEIAREYLKDITDPNMKKAIQSVIENFYSEIREMKEYLQKSSL